MDPYLTILLYIIYLVSAVIISFLTIIVILRIKNAREEKQYRLCEKKWEKLFIDYILGKSELNNIIKPFLKNKNYHFFRKFFTPYLEMLDGRDFEATKALCREISMIGYYRERLLKRNIYDRATAAKMLGDFRCYQSISTRIRMLKSKNHLLVLAAAQGLAVSNNPRVFSPVLKALVSNSYFTYEGITEILSRFSIEVCRPITALLDKYSRGELPVKFIASRKKKGAFRYLIAKPKAAEIDLSLMIMILIDLLGHYRYTEALSVLNCLLAGAENETIIHIMKAFLRIGKLPASYNPGLYLENEDWVIRSFAIQTTKLAPADNMMPMLDQLLNDENWWVRYHAAKALIAAGSTGSSLLTQKADGSKTKAATIAAYVLASKEVS